MAFVYALLVLAACLVGCCLYGAFLFARHLWRRYRASSAGLLPRGDLPGPSSGFDTSGIAQEVIRVRTDYLKALHCRPHPRTHPTSYLCAARQVHAASSYFRLRQIDEERSNENPG